VPCSDNVGSTAPSAVRESASARKISSCARRKSMERARSIRAASSQVVMTCWGGGIGASIGSSTTTGGGESVDALGGVAPGVLGVTALGALGALGGGVLGPGACAIERRLAKRTEVKAPRVRRRERIAQLTTLLLRIVPSRSARRSNYWRSGFAKRARASGAATSLRKTFGVDSSNYCGR